MKLSSQNTMWPWVSQCGKTRNSITEKKKSSNQLFRNFFSKTLLDAVFEFIYTNFAIEKKMQNLDFPHCATWFTLDFTEKNRENE